MHALNVPFGRPQGLAFDAGGVLHVVEALAGSSGVYAIRSDRDPELVLAGAGLVGLAFGPAGEMVVASNDSVFSFQRRMTARRGRRPARAGRGVARPSHHVDSDAARAPARSPGRVEHHRDDPGCRDASDLRSVSRPRPGPRSAAVAVARSACSISRSGGSAASSRRMTPYRTIDHAEAQQLLEAGTATVIDVRTPGEYAQLGHIPGAWLLPVDLMASAPAVLPDDRAAGSRLLRARRAQPRRLGAARGGGHRPRAESCRRTRRLARSARIRTGVLRGPSPWLIENADLLPRGGRVLDVACGRGRHALLLASAGFDVRAIDRNPDAIDVRARYGGEARVAHQRAKSSISKPSRRRPSRLNSTRFSSSTICIGR